MTSGTSVNSSTVILLYKALSGSTSFSTISAMADSKANASVFRSNNGGVNPVLLFDTYYWYPMLLSRDKNNNVILTLWLANTYVEDNYYDGLYGGAVANFESEYSWYGLGSYVFYGDYEYYTLPDETVPEKVRIYTDIGFSNGYMYAPLFSNKDEYDYFPRNESRFNFFSADNYSMPDNLYKTWADYLWLTSVEWEAFVDGELVYYYQGGVDLVCNYCSSKYCVKPRDVAWQENQSAKEILGMTYNLPNESWSTTVSDDGFYSSENNYADISGSDGWADEYVWLPSLSEIGYSDTNGLWGASAEQRACYDVDASRYKVGYNEISGRQSTWTRSANYKQSYGYYFIKSDGNGKAVGSFGARVYRPCVHLNLTAIEADR